MRGNNTEGILPEIRDVAIGGDATVECRNLGFRYGRRDVFSDVSFTLMSGVVGLLGANGAGKTTLLTILATLRMPKSGQALLLGEDVTSVTGRERIRRSLGYLPQTVEVMGSSTVFDNVAYAAWAHGVDSSEVGYAVERALEAVGLMDVATLRARKLSGGQRRRLGIACAIAHQPRVLLLDEPTAGVDPLQRVRLHQLMTLIGKKSTVVVSTHLADEAARVADYLLIMRDGGLAFAGSPQMLSECGMPGMDVARVIETVMAGER